MLSMKLINDYIKRLETTGEVEKTLIIKMFDLLIEFGEIETKVIYLKKLIKGLIESEAIEKYLEIGDFLFCLETFKEFELLTVSAEEDKLKLKKIEELEKIINKGFQSLDKLIDLENHKLEELLEEKEALIESIFADAQNKAVSHENVLIVQKGQGDSEIILKD